MELTGTWCSHIHPPFLVRSISMHMHGQSLTLDLGSEGGETPKFSAILPLPGEHLEQAEEAEEGELVVAESPVLPRSSRSLVLGCTGTWH